MLPRPLYLSIYLSIYLLITILIHALALLVSAYFTLTPSLCTQATNHRTSSSASPRSTTHRSARPKQRVLKKSRPRRTPPGWTLSKTSGARHTMVLQFFVTIHTHTHAHTHTHTHTHIHTHVAIEMRRDRSHIHIHIHIAHRSHDDYHTAQH